MSVKHLELTFSAGSNYTSDAWYVQDLGNGSIQLIWSSLDALTGTAEIQASNDEVNWKLSGCSCSQITLSSASSNEIWEFKGGFTTRYIRLVYTKNTVTSGTLTIRSFGQALRGPA